MKEVFNQLYNGILRFIPASRYLKLKSSQKGLFPEVGFLTLEKLHELEYLLNIKIHKKEYFEQALTHRSYLQVIDNPDCLSNERLEFLGDAILGMLVAEYLFSLHSKVPEGELTKMRSWLVNRNSLAIAAEKLKLDDFIVMSFSAETSLKKGSSSILADAMEAIIAAIYLDSGISAAKEFILNSLIPILMDKKVMTDKNYKSILLEKVQAEGKNAPVYNVLDESGPDHEKHFKVGVFIDNKKVGVGEGKSKKKAEQTAAENALKKLNY